MSKAGENGWDEMKSYVIPLLDDLKDGQKRANDRISTFEGRLIVLEVKMAFYCGIGTMAGSVISALIIHFATR